MAFNKMVEEKLDSNTYLDRKEYGVTMNINMREVVMKRDRVPGLGMVESLIHRQLLCVSQISKGRSFSRLC